MAPQMTPGLTPELAAYYESFLIYPKPAVRLGRRGENPGWPVGSWG